MGWTPSCIRERDEQRCPWDPGTPAGTQLLQRVGGLTRSSWPSAGPDGGSRLQTPAVQSRWKCARPGNPRDTYGPMKVPQRQSVCRPSLPLWGVLLLILTEGMFPQ